MSNSTRLPVPQQADAYLRALQNDLAAKRSAAFSRDQPHGPQPRYVAPIRSNAPRMGADGYETPQPRAGGGLAARTGLGGRGRTECGVLVWADGFATRGGRPHQADRAMTTTEAILNRSLELIWQIRRDKQEAAREQAIRDAIALDNDRIRWQHYQSIVSRNGAKCEYEHTEIV